MIVNKQMKEWISRMVHSFSVFLPVLQFLFFLIHRLICKRGIAFTGLDGKFCRFSKIRYLLICSRDKRQIQCAELSYV